MAVLCSSRAPGLETLLERSAEDEAPYRVVRCVSSDPGCAEAGLLERHNVPLEVCDLRRFYAERDAPVEDLDLRAVHDRSILDALAPADPDLLLLDGYLWVITGVLLDAFPERVLNIHHADLTRTGPDGRPLYRGLRAVRDAIRSGEPETRSTVHLATAVVDEGPLLARSGPFPVHPLAADARRRGRDDVVKAYAYAHREWMMAASWGPLLDRVLGWMAGDRVEVSDGRVRVDGRAGPRTVTTATGTADADGAEQRPGVGAVGRAGTGEEAMARGAAAAGRAP